MAGQNSTKSVVAALAGNTVITIAKFIAFWVTGSGAMLSEAIHTLADVMNQALLLTGVVRSERVADDEHPYGYLRERFVWALISAVGIFFLGCGLTLYHGISSLFHPKELSGLEWAIGVLLVSLVIEGWVFMVAFRSLHSQKGEAPFFEFLRTRADPPEVAVLLEDFAACLGLVIAMVCIGLTQWTGQMWWDSVGSITIGLLLGVVAILLIARNRELLIGQSAPLEARQKVREVLLQRASVADIVETSTEMLDTHSYDLLINVHFSGRNFAESLRVRLRDKYRDLSKHDSFEAFTDEFAACLLKDLGQEIDAIEAEIRKVVPEAVHIDIEPQ